MPPPSKPTPASCMRWLATHNESAAVPAQMRQRVIRVGVHWMKKRSGEKQSGAWIANALPPYFTIHLHSSSLWTGV